MVNTNGGFPPPVSRTHRVTYPEKEWENSEEGKPGQRLKWALTPQTGPVNQSKSVLFFSPLLVTDQIADREPVRAFIIYFCNSDVSHRY